MSFVSEKVKRACAIIQSESGTGTGYLIDPLWVVTCAHVVGSESKASAVSLIFCPNSLEDRIETGGTVEGLDHEHDVAFIKLNTPITGITPLVLTDGIIEDTQWISFGYPQISRGHGLVIEGKIDDVSGHLKRIIPNDDSPGLTRAEAGILYATHGSAVIHRLPPGLKEKVLPSAQNKQELINAIWQFELERPALLREVYRHIQQEQPVAAFAVNRAGK